MEHIAFLDKKRKLLAKILSGEKTIESRWYASRRTPWKRIAPNDIVYFKESGEPVSAKAIVEKVLFFELTPAVVKDLLKKHGRNICIPMSYYSQIKGKRYCILVFLKEVKKIEPFAIDKTGFGNMAAWITTENVSSLRK